MGQVADYVDGGVRVCIVTNALVIEVGGDEWFVELPVPELEEGRGDVRVGTVGRWNPLVTPCLECVHFIDITGNPATATQYKSLISSYCNL